MKVLISTDTSCLVNYEGLEKYNISVFPLNVIVDGEGDDFVEIVNGKAVMTVSLGGIDNGDYKLLISSFVGAKKADQPLKISGDWICEFSA